MFRTVVSLARACLAAFRTPARRQVAALCWRDGARGVEILLVTTRRTGRWTPPRGWPVEGRSLSESAAVEAWEEAGANGEAGPEPLGTYRYEKLKGEFGGFGGVCVEVSVYPMKVTGLDADYREAGQRKRCWMSREDAAAAVHENDLRRIFLAFTP